MEGVVINYSHAAEASLPDPTSPEVLALRVLIIENDTDSVPDLRQTLSQAGFAVSSLNPRQAARDALDREHPHLVMLDWDIPGTVTMDLMRNLRRQAASGGPRLIAFSSFAGDQHVVSGLELGLDDYVIKPFSVREVVARVKAILRPSLMRGRKSNYIAFEQLQMDASEARVTVQDKTVPLRRIEFMLLEFFMRRPGRAHSRETLLHCVWGNDSCAGLRAVDVTVQRVRRALAPYGCGNYLQTIRGVGYRLSTG
jgi:two-component system phosphate regulon response regulator PhoB